MLGLDVEAKTSTVVPMVDDAQPGSVRVELRRFCVSNYTLTGITRSSAVAVIADRTAYDVSSSSSSSLGGAIA